MLLKCRRLESHEPLDIEDSLFVQETQDWIKPPSSFLLHMVLPSNCSGALKVKRKSPRIFAEEGQLFRRGFNQASLRCLLGGEMKESLNKFKSECVGSTKGAL